MAREKAKQLLPIIQAYAEGKTIEWFSAIDGAKWEELTQPLFDARMQYRIKPEEVLIETTTCNSWYSDKDVVKIISLTQAVTKGKTLQTQNGKGGWVDVKDLIVNDLLLYFDKYRIKPELKYNLELTIDELDVIKSSLSAFIMAKTNEVAQKLSRNILDNIENIEGVKNE